MIDPQRDEMEIELLGVGVGSIKGFAERSGAEYDEKAEKGDEVELDDVGTLRRRVW